MIHKLRKVAIALLSIVVGTTSLKCIAVDTSFCEPIALLDESWNKDQFDSIQSRRLTEEEASLLDRSEPWLSILKLPNAELCGVEPDDPYAVAFQCVWRSKSPKEAKAQATALWAALQSCYPTMRAKQSTRTARSVFFLERGKQEPGPLYIEIYPSHADILGLWVWEKRSK